MTFINTRGTGTAGATLVMCLTLLASPAAHANYIFDVDRTLPCTSWCSGDITVQGAIEVDMLGTLAASNFVDWTLTFASTNHMNTVLDPTNSNVILSGAAGSVVATLTELTITQPGLSSPGSFVLGISDTVAFPFIVGWQFQGGDGDSAEEIQSNSPFGAFDQGFVNYPDDPLVVTLPAAAPPIPEPTTFALLGLGLAGISYRRLKHSKA
ncbi:MAG: PEP-CTERM sorting domain-containing protein [Gammaproteobacteria bacterium]|nr:PEP-CTERM sorting domain-containing protein [Gammaproteobacteria bacterium]